MNNLFKLVNYVFCSVNQLQTTFSGIVRHSNILGYTVAQNFMVKPVLTPICTTPRMITVKRLEMSETPPPTYEESCIPGYVDATLPLQPGYRPSIPLEGNFLLWRQIYTLLLNLNKSCLLPIVLFLNWKNFSLLTTALQPSTVIVTNNLRLQPQLGTSPVRMICPICNSTIITRIHKQPGTVSYIVAIVLCFL